MSPKILMNDLTLCQLCAQGSSEAWTTLVERFSPGLRSTIRHTLRRFDHTHNLEDLTEDLLASFLLSLMEHGANRLQRFEFRSSLATFLRVAAANFTIDHIRRQRPCESLDTPPNSNDTAPPEPVSPDASAELVSSRAELAQALQRWWAELPTDDRDLAELVFVDALPAAQIAQQLQLSVANVYTRTCWLRKRLQARALTEGWAPPALRAS
jgi:RNA polymerase sigma factor (sigma-70 family)